MSDDETPRASAAPLSNCEIVTASSSADAPESEKEQQQDKNAKENVSPDATVQSPPNQPDSTSSSTAESPLSDDHEVTKGRQQKCVQFTISTTGGTAADDTLRKFIEGEEILDKKNPFKIGDEQCEFEYHVRHRQPSDNSPRDKHFPANAIIIGGGDHDGGNDADESDDHDDDSVFVTTEEVLRQSKYVKTYIKNPDKQLNYDKSVIQKLNAIKAKGRAVRDLVIVDGEDGGPPVSSGQPVRPPIPAPRAVYQQSDKNDKNNNSNNNRMKPFSTLGHTRGIPKPTPRARRDYTEVKVRIGSAEAEESLYDSNEVVQNALKFDSRFRKVEFGSQDDIDTIAERTDDSEERKPADDSPAVVITASEKQPNASPVKDQPDGRKTSFAEEVKKSFSNTVKSADFRKYLQSKGLSLVPAKPQRGKQDALRLSGISASSTPSPATTPARPSVLTRLFQHGLFAPKTPHDPAYSTMFARSSTPVLFSSQSPTTRPTVRFGSFNGTLNKRFAAADAKPKVNFKQLLDGQRDQQQHHAVDATRRPLSVSDFDRPKLRTHFANRSVSSVDSLKRGMKNAGVQVNLAANGTRRQQHPADGSQVISVPQRPGSWQPGNAIPLNASAVSRSKQQQQQQQQQQALSPAYQTVRLRPDNRFYAGSSHTVAPLYSEPLREAPMMVVQDELDSGFRSTADNGYHIYEQTPDNLRRNAELMYGRIGYYRLGGQPQDCRSYSSMQEDVSGLNGTYGRLRPLYVSSPLSTQSTPVRRASETLDREQILHRIYDFCRRSIRNSSKTSVHSNQTEPIYQSSHAPPTTKIVPSGTFPIDRQQQQQYHRVQRVQSLNSGPRSITAGTVNYTRVAAVPNVQPRTATVRQNQHERNIENIYAFVNKKMVQMNVNAADTMGARAVQTSAPSTLRRVTFSNKHGRGDDGHDEADYVNIRGAPDGKQTALDYYYILSNTSSCM